MVYLIIGFIGFVLSMSLLLALQLISCYPLYKMGKNRGIIGSAWMFMPIYNIYMMCKLADRDVKIIGDIKIKREDFPRKIFKAYLWLLAINIIIMAITSIIVEAFSGIFKIILSLCMILPILMVSILECYIVYKIRVEIAYPYLKDEITSRIIAISSIFISIIFWVFTLLMMNKNITKE